MDLAKLQNESFERTIRIIVFSRFDGRIVNPFDDPVAYECQNDSDMPALDMYLYNTTEDSHTGLHYDPVTVREVNPVSNGKTIQANEKATPAVTRSGRKRLRKTGALNLHDEVPSFLKIKAKCVGNCFDESACAAKLRPGVDGDAARRSSIEDARPDEVGSEPEVNEKDKDPFYIVYSMSGVNSPDKARYMLEDTLDTLSFEFREHPTLPSVSSDKTKAVAGALAKDTALLLPLKHCAFTHCSWCGETDTDLLHRLLADHIEQLRPSMDAFQHLRPVGAIDQNELGISVYNEALAIRIQSTDGV